MQPRRKASLNKPAEYAPGMKHAIYCIAFGIILNGKYAPIKKPIHVVITPFTATKVLTLLKNPQTNTKKNDDDKTDINVTAKTSKKSPHDI